MEITQRRRLLLSRARFSTTSTTPPTPGPSPFTPLDDTSARGATTDQSDGNEPPRPASSLPTSTLPGSSLSHYPRDTDSSKFVGMFATHRPSVGRELLAGGTLELEGSQDDVDPNSPVLSLDAMSSSSSFLNSEESSSFNQPSFTNIHESTNIYVPWVACPNYHSLLNQVSNCILGIHNLIIWKLYSIFNLNLKHIERTSIAIFWRVS